MSLITFSFVCISDAHARLCQSSQPISVDYCALFDKLCENGRCINLEGSFRCECNPGYRNDSAGNCIGECWCQSLQLHTFIFKAKLCVFLGGLLFVVVGCFSLLVLLVAVFCSFWVTALMSALTRA